MEPCQYQYMSPAQGWPRPQRECVADQKGKLTRDSVCLWHHETPIEKEARLLQGTLGQTWSCQATRQGSNMKNRGHGPVFWCLSTLVGKRCVVIQMARLLNYDMQKAAREQTQEQAAARQSEQERQAAARREAGKAKAAAAKKRKAEEAEKTAEAAREAEVNISQGHCDISRGSEHLWMPFLHQAPRPAFPSWAGDEQVHPVRSGW